MEPLFNIEIVTLVRGSSWSILICRTKLSYHMETKHIVVVSYGNRELDKLCGNKDKKYLVCPQTKKVLALIEEETPRVVLIRESERRVKPTERFFCESIGDALTMLAEASHVWILAPQESVPLLTGFLQLFQKRSRYDHAIPKFRILIDSFNQAQPFAVANIFTVYYRKASEYYASGAHDHWVAFLERYPVTLKRHLEKVPLEHAAASDLEEWYRQVCSGDHGSVRGLGEHMLNELLNISLDRKRYDVADMLAKEIARRKK